MAWGPDSNSLVYRGLRLISSSFHAGLFFINADGTNDRTLTPSLQTGAPGTLVTFSGTLLNTGASTLYLNSDAVTLLGAGLSLDDSGFAKNTPQTLAAGAMTSQFALFTVSIDPATVFGSYPGQFTVQGGGDNNAQTALATSGFTVVVAPATPPGTPEPGTISLLSGLGVSAALLAKRRLRRR